MSQSDDSGEDIYTDAPNFLDEEGDWMALGVGIGHGFRQINPRPKATPATRRNKFYYYPAFALGYVLKAVAVALMAFAGASVV